MQAKFKNPKTRAVTKTNPACRRDISTFILRITPLAKDSRLVSGKCSVNGKAGRFREDYDRKGRKFVTLPPGRHRVVTIIPRTPPRGKGGCLLVFELARLLYRLDYPPRSIVDAVILRPLPLDESNHLLKVWSTR
ncbi:MAG: hypothetical protein M2R45_04335 [Verrucomicrobia subdivision 3 bacterium]|nr:hypothetical protein [Limisphaerales bacterium]MCS1416039.1 hypothetical protein [Limisphaerales bacterium]